MALNLKLSDLTVRRPFVSPLPKYQPNNGVTRNPFTHKEISSNGLWKVIPQSQFIREYYTSGHLINDNKYYPDRIKYDEDTDKFFTEKMVRCTFPFQMMITAQHLVHIVGNDIRHEITKSKITEEERKLFGDWCKGWLVENIETALYHFYKSTFVTGEAALVLYLKDGKMYHKNFSFLYGDTLYPHYNSVTGEMDCFGRKFSEYDEENKETVQWLEVWDEKYLYRFRQNLNGLSGQINKAKKWLGLDGWIQVGKEEPHGFDRVPIAYHRREEGACWSAVQDLIDKFELAVSYLCQNNMAYAFPIMVLQGDNVDIQGDIYGQVKAITADSDAKISYLERGNNTESFKLQIDILLKQIFLGSFSVMPPEVHSGDLPGVAIKLIYSPSLDRAMIDAKEFDHVIDDVQKLFSFAYGVQEQKERQFRNLEIISYIEPYVHQNTAELINNLVQSVNSGILSKRTASELSGYGKNDEFDQIIMEFKEENAADKLFQNNNTKSMNEESNGE